MPLRNARMMVTSGMLPIHSLIHSTCSAADVLCTARCACVTLLRDVLLARGGGTCVAVEMCAAKRIRLDKLMCHRFSCAYLLACIMSTPSFAMLMCVFERSMS